MMIQAVSMNGIGWFKFYRELLDKAIWKCSTPEQKVILITLLTMVNFRDNEWMWEGKKYKVEPGQMITSLESIAKESGKGISIQNVRTALIKFETFEFLTNVSTNKNRLITIVNWELYQSKEDELTYKLTSNQQATNKQLTTIEESKKEKKETIPENDLESIVDKFNLTCKTLPGIKKLTDKRKVILKKWIKEDGIETIYEVFEKVTESDFLSGRIENPDRPWKASFDWIINPTNRLKILEGNYTNNPGAETKRKGISMDV